MRKAKDETITDREVDEVAASLLAGNQPDQVYKQVYILGRSFARRHENLLADHLVYPANPEVSATALGMLCAQWKLGRKYRVYILAGLSGLDWDTDGDVRTRAISAAGEYLRDNGDHEVLTDLIAVAESNGALESRFAWESIARALGDSYNEAIPRRDPNENAQWIASLRTRAADRLRIEPEA